MASDENTETRLSFVTLSRKYMYVYIPAKSMQKIPLLITLSIVRWNEGCIFS